MVLLFLVAMYGVVAVTVPVLAPLRPAMTLALGALGFLLIERTLSGRPFRLSWPESHALVAFFGVAALSSFDALWPGLAVSNTIELAKLLVLYLLIVNVVSTRARLRILLWTMVLGGVMPALGTIQNHMLGNVVGGRAAWEGTFANPNEVAFELAILVPLAIALMSTTKWWGKLLLCGAVGSYLAAILFTYSRSGLLGLGAMVVAGVFKLRSPAARALVVACVIVAVTVGVQFWEREEDFGNLESDANFRSRLVSIQAGLAMFQASPFFGIGIGCSGLGWQEFSPNTYVSTDGIMIHNTFVEALAETGLFGFTCLMIAILGALRRMHGLSSRAAAGFASAELRHYATAIELSVVAFLVAGLANGLARAHAIYLLIALASATRGIVLDEWRSEQEA